MRPVPFEETPTRRGGHADGRCKLKGCAREVGPTRANLFYCTVRCGQLANPEVFDEVECPMCGGHGTVPR